MSSVVNQQTKHINSVTLKTRMKNILTHGSAILISLSMFAGSASAVSFDLHANIAQFFGGNDSSSSFYKVNFGTPDVESGSAAATFSTTVGGDADTGWYAEVSFNGPQPFLTEARLKAGNGYLLWDSTDLAAFNAGSFTGIKLWNDAGGIVNTKGKFLEISHINLDGRTTTVPDGGGMLALLGLAVAGLGIFRRTLA